MWGPHEDHCFSHPASPQAPLALPAPTPLPRAAAGEQAGGSCKQRSRAGVCRPGLLTAYWLRDREQSLCYASVSPSVK